METFVFIFVIAVLSIIYIFIACFIGGMMNASLEGSFVNLRSFFSGVFWPLTIVYLWGWAFLAWLFKP